MIVDPLPFVHPCPMVTRWVGFRSSSSIRSAALHNEELVHGIHWHKRAVIVRLYFLRLHCSTQRTATQCCICDQSSQVRMARMQLNLVLGALSAIVAAFYLGFNVSYRMASGTIGGSFGRAGTSNWNLLSLQLTQLSSQLIAAR